MTGAFRGIYIARLDLAARHLVGVARKVEAQRATLEGLPACMDRLCISDGRIAFNDLVNKDTSKGRLARRLTYYLRFHFAVAALRGYDFAYIRYQGSSPLMLWALHRIRWKNPGSIVILEVPTFPYEHARVSVRDQALWIVERMSRPFLRFLVDRVVTYSRQERIFGIPTLATDNGVDVEANSVIEPPPGEPLRLLGLANLSLWHGYDRVIAGLADYYAMGGARDVRFIVIGEGSELPRLRQQAESMAMGTRVSFVGTLKGEALDAAMAEMHIGISCLGIHRVPSDTTSLKSREFCARGLPFVLGFDERDFRSELPFVFQIPACDDPIDVAGLLQWFDSLDTRLPNYPLAIRTYAEKHLSWKTKLRPVVTYLQEALGLRISQP